MLADMSGTKTNPPDRWVFQARQAADSHCGHVVASIYLQRVQTEGDGNTSIFGRRTFHNQKGEFVTKVCIGITFE